MNDIVLEHFDTTSGEFWLRRMCLLLLTESQGAHPWELCAGGCRAWSGPSDCCEPRSGPWLSGCWSDCALGAPCCCASDRVSRSDSAEAASAGVVRATCSPRANSDGPSWVADTAACRPFPSSCWASFAGWVAAWTDLRTRGCASLCTAPSSAAAAVAVVARKSCDWYWGWSWTSFDGRDMPAMHHGHTMSNLWIIVWSALYPLVWFLACFWTRII